MTDGVTRHQLRGATFLSTKNCALVHCLCCGHKYYTICNHAPLLAALMPFDHFLVDENYVPDVLNPRWRLICPEDLG